MCHVSHVACHMSHVTCHMSHVKCHMYKKKKYGGAWRSRVCYQRGLPRLVFNAMAPNRLELIRWLFIGISPCLRISQVQQDFKFVVLVKKLRQCQVGMQWGEFCYVMKLLVLSIWPTMRLTMTYGVCVTVSGGCAITNNGWTVKSCGVSKGRVLHQCGYPV